MKLAIYRNQNNDLEIIEQAIMKRGIALGHSFDAVHPEVVIVIGGDGSILRAIHHYINQLDELSIVGFNAGYLGFLTQADDIEDLFNLLKDGNFAYHSHRLLKAEIGEIKKIYALNEIRLENPFKTLICDVLIDGVALETFRGNGLNISSEIGASAYNKSLGGALVDHSLDILQISEIAGISHNVSNTLSSSLVLSGDKVITLKGDFHKVVIGYDHLTDDDIHFDEVKISKSNKKVKLIHPINKTYIHAIKRSFIK